MRDKLYRFAGVACIFASELFEVIMLAAAKLLQERSQDEDGINVVQVSIVEMCVHNLWPSLTCKRFSLYALQALSCSVPFICGTQRRLIVSGGLPNYASLWFPEALSVSLEFFVSTVRFRHNLPPELNSIDKSVTDSAEFLSLAEAQTLAYITPIFAAIFSAITLRIPWTKPQMFGGLCSMIGVLTITRPRSLLIFFDSKTAPNFQREFSSVGTSYSRPLAIIAGIGAAIFAAMVCTIIRAIGNRCHPLISVNYLAMVGSISTAGIMSFNPSTACTMPRKADDWILLSIVAVSGFFLQFLLTKGLQLDRSNNVISAMYLSIILALGLDWLFWKKSPDLTSALGGALVLVSVYWVIFQNTRSAHDTQYDCESDGSGSKTPTTHDVIISLEVLDV